MSFNIYSDAVKLRISCGQAGTHVKLPSISEEVAKSHGISTEDVESSIVVLKKADTQKYQQIVTAARAAHKFWTSPWEDGGWRMLLLTNRAKVLKLLNDFKDSADTIVREGILDRYDDIYADARKRLNGLFSLIRFPSREELAEKYYFDLSEEPICNPGDVRLRHVDPEVEQAIKDSTAKAQASKLKAAQDDLVERIEEMLVRVASLPVEERKDDGKKARWHDTAILNIRDSIEVLGSLNFNQDPKLDAVIKALGGKLAVINPESLRKSKNARVNAINAALEILEDLDAATGQTKQRPAKVAAKQERKPKVQEPEVNCTPKAVVDLSEGYVNKTVATMLGMDPEKPITRADLDEHWKGMPAVADAMMQQMREAARVTHTNPEPEPEVASEPEPEPAQVGGSITDDLLSISL